MQTSHFDYILPPDCIAQSPIKPRDHSRLLVLDRASHSWQHHHFYEIGDFLKPGDLLIVNESKVFKARLFATVGARFIAPSDRLVAPSDRSINMPEGDMPEGVMNHAPTKIEIFLLRPDGATWIVLAKPGRKLQAGSTIAFQDGTKARVEEKLDDGTIRIAFDRSAEEIFAWTDMIGSVPVPPYVEKAPTDQNDYQTVYANSIGSVAAPTAGFHFTPELIEKLKQQGVKFASITLHVGLGTFRPMKTETLEEHVMHSEWVNVPPKTLEAIADAKRQGGRVIAVGTTTVRALESSIEKGFTNIFITPGYQFKLIDGLITNFHLPKSTLLVLVSALAGREFILKAYQEAIKEKYRFYSFGDAMLII